jgi:hypothetical protein
MISKSRLKGALGLLVAMLFSGLFLCERYIRLFLRISILGSQLYLLIVFFFFLFDFLVDFRPLRYP